MAISESLLTQGDPHPSNGNPDAQSALFDYVGLPEAPLLKTIELVLQTAFLKTPTKKPISLILIGQAGIGKTRILSLLQERFDFVTYLNDVTPIYLVEFLKEVKEGKKKFLVIPDFTNCLSHGKNTRNTLIAILRSMTEEGVTNLSDYHLEFKSDTPIRAGLITAITNSSYNQFSRAWKTTGFLSRLLPFSFSLSPETIEKIQRDIDERREELSKEIGFKINRRPKEVQTNPTALVQLRAYEDLLANQTDSLPFRSQIQLNSLAESSAVLSNHQRIEQEDVNTVHGISKFFNYSFNQI